jgi:hypothetical protein
MRILPILASAVTLGLAGGYVWSAMPPAIAEPAAAPQPVKSPAEIEHSVYYPNCAGARADGHAPIFAGQPGYRSALDADGDGIACEPYRGS